MNKTLENPIPKTNTEWNRWKKAKYKQKKKMQKKSTTATRKPYKIDKKPRMKRQWTWTIKNSKHIKLQHRRALLSIYRLSNIKEQNLANIHNLQTLLLTTFLKTSILLLLPPLHLLLAILKISSTLYKAYILKTYELTEESHLYRSQPTTVSTPPSKE